MKLKPINLSLFHRSLVSDNRQWQGYAFRFVMLIIIGFILTQIVAMSQYRNASAIGKDFFQAVMVGNVVFVTLLAITLFSTAITEEKDNSSLGLLLMTGISTISLLMSKSFSKLLIAIMLILMQFPFTLLAITLGGVGFTQIFHAYITLICYTILVSTE
jgi:ABC-type transport system involved in multi-copper enzyme maturation permease subunit